jgi:hypothetical protein
MAKDLEVILEDRPGKLADMCEVLGKAGINIEGLAGAPAGGGAMLHVVVEDTVAARRVLDAARIRVHEERDVLVLELQDYPGELGQVSRKLANAGVNITLVFLATKSRLILGVDDAEKALAALLGT